MVEKLKILVAVSTYLNRIDKDTVTNMYFHTRNKYYQERGAEVTVLDFSCTSKYGVDGINVIGLSDYKLQNKKYDLLVCHAPNLRNHYLFYKKFGRRFYKSVWFFHGHEVLKYRTVYPKPYTYMQEHRFLKSFLQNQYDWIKLHLWHSFFKNDLNNKYLIFVSKWMRDEFEKNLKIKENTIKGHYAIIPNSIGEIFERERYDRDSDKLFDFITVRNNIDGSKYCIDIVNELAEKNPKMKFLVVGRGKYFEHNKKSPNITWEDTQLGHEEIIKRLNLSKCALMPTRTDSQGVMMCEMATFGIPLITSDIPVCHEILENFSVVKLINNQEINSELNDMLQELSKNKFKENKIYFKNVCCEKEFILFEKLLKD